MHAARVLAAAFLGVLFACGAESTKTAEPLPRPSATASTPVIAPSATASSAPSASASAVASAAPSASAASAPVAEEVVDAGPPHVAVALVGKCVDPIADAKVRGHLPKDLPLAMEPLQIDLDGDGVDDWIITTGADATDYSGEVYMTRNKCAVWVLRWVGSAPMPLTTTTRGFLDLAVGKPCKKGCCSAPDTLYKWNGRTYARSGTQPAPPCNPMRTP